jgi:hypothetical protein
MIYEKDIDFNIHRTDCFTGNNLFPAKGLDA